MPHRLQEQAISRATENTAFACERCGTPVGPLTGGSYRNHCPSCLWSKHLDDRPGDRRSTCGGLMEPISLDHRSGKGLLVVHRCVVCGVVRRNRAALDDPRQPDDAAALGRLQAAPPDRMSPRAGRTRSMVTPSDRRRYPL